MSEPMSEPMSAERFHYIHSRALTLPYDSKALMFELLEEIIKLRAQTPELNQWGEWEWRRKR